MIQELLDDKVQGFIRENESADPFDLVLKKKEVAGVPIKYIAEQIAGRQIAKTKLPFWYKCESVIYPPKLSLEQCSSEITAFYKTSIVSGKTFADLTGGTGVDTAALASSFDEGYYIEQNKQLVDLAIHNFDALAINKIKCHHSTAEDFLLNYENKLDCIYIDPARRGKNKNKVFLLSDCTPDITKLLPKLLSKADKVLVKTSPMMDIDQSLKSMYGVQEVHIIALENECKEVLYLVTNDSASSIAIKTANILKNGNIQKLDFDWNKRVGPVHYVDPSNYLYEPNVAILKSGAFQLVANQFNVKKLAPNTHLYTSDVLIDDFPGRVFKIDHLLPYSKKEIKKALPDNKANITARNFVDDVKSIRKKIGLKDGGSTYLFACKLYDQTPVVIKCSKVN